MPTSKAQGVFIGLVEVKGTAECEQPVRSFLGGTACVHYHYEVLEHWSRTVTESYTDSKGNRRTRTRRESGWKSVASDSVSVNFYVRDETGAVLVRPSGATIEPTVFFEQTVTPGDALYYGKGPPTAVAHSDHRRRFVEHGIALHAPLFVVGQAREREDVVAPEIAANPDADLFLISTRTEEKVQGGAALGSWVCWGIGLVVIVAVFLVAMQRHDSGIAPAQRAPLIVAAASAYLVAWSVGWVWMVFNSLVKLRNCVRQAWSLIEVELKRRHDLIPNLVAAVSALASHERETQTALAALRTQLAATPPGVAGPEFDGVAGALRVVIERYPTLTAQPGFAQLHEGLVETEQRIALARTYYNDIATQFATRLQIVPDRFVALLGAMRAEPLLAAAGFERENVTVAFAESA